MKMIKKITTLLLAICLVVPCFSFVTEAASGTLVFSDPTTAVGQEVTVDVKIRAESAVGNGTATVVYDATALEFIDGTHATGGAGTVALEAEGDGTATELSYILKFRALKEGETQLSVSNYTASLHNKENLDLTLGTSAVAIGPGDGTALIAEPIAAGTGTVKIEDKEYVIVDTFSDTEIPRGFVRGTRTYDGIERQIVLQETSGQEMMYLQDPSGTAEFYLYDPETDAFTPFVKIDISETAYIILLDKTGKTKLSSEYVETVLTVENGATFPTWVNAKNADFYIVYALNSDGTKGYYQYDKKYETYQRFTPAVEEKKVEAKGLLGKITKLVEEYMTYALIAVWGVFLLFLIIIIVLGVKLRHRNQELDELYDEEDEDDNSSNNNGTISKGRANFALDEEEDFDDFDDELDDEMDFDQFEDLSISAVSRSQAESKPVANPQTVSQDTIVRPVKAERSPRSATRSKGVIDKFDDDDFSVDFIDLDD